VRSLSRRHLVELKRELAQAFSSGGEDGVANAGTDECQRRRLADAGNANSGSDPRSWAPEKTYLAEAILQFFETASYYFNCRKE
jgi:hypothetical protein